LTFADSVQLLETRLGQHVVTGAIDNASDAAVARILAHARAEGLEFGPFSIDRARYERFCAAAGYVECYPSYYPDNRREKMLEHFVALELLGLHADDVLIDVASEHSPLSEIVSRLTGARAYSQDIMYPAGLHDARIGGDACAMPVVDCFATRAVLTCSLEHFEGDADERLFVELHRVLAPGGMVCVVPFYLLDRPATQTDPVVSVSADVPFDADATIHCTEGWGNRHGRFYSPGSFRTRVLLPLADRFRFAFLHLTNAAEIDPSVYARFAFTATRR
jgi:SAM-dependent methyltransferase